MMKLKNLVLNTDEAANEILKNWEHDENSLNFWRGSANYVYYFTNKGEKYWLRFAKEDENSLEQIEAEIEFLLYLNNSGFPTVHSIESKNNKYIEVVKNGANTYYAVVFSNAEGVSLDIDELSESQFECWGKSLASLHTLSKAFKPEHHVRNSWKDALQFIKDVFSGFPNEKYAAEELNRVEQWLSSLPATDNDFGLIHYDYELDNVFFNEKLSQFYVIDYDSSMYHWYAMDIVCALGDLQDLEASKAQSGLQSFLKGYSSIIAIDEVYIKLLPEFERFDNLFTFAKLLRSLQDSSLSHEPDWLQRLRPRLLKKCDAYREGFKRRFCN